MEKVLLLVRLAWAGPNTVLGLALGTAGLLTGGKVRRVGPILEFHGGAVAFFLKHMTLLKGGASAMTLGHTVLGRSEWDLDFCRDHEMVHVRQYERWGPAFLPAYLGCSAYLWLKGRDFYLENPFEREAYNQERQSGAE